jgi:LuxR family maltose regulon positive regulatory protein
VVWISLDEDDDVARALACIAGALAPLDLPWHVSPAALPVLAAESGLRAVSSEIVNALGEAAVARGVLVFEDVHRVTDARIATLIAQLIEGLPPSWGLVIVSRREPAIALSRWRAAGQLAEFRQDDLRFDGDEVAALLERASRRDLPADRLLARSEGWAAGLRLLLDAPSLPAQPGAPAGTSAPSARPVFEYLADEVMASMSADMRAFLLRCSVLPELTAERCAQVSGMPNARDLFEEVERQGLFVSALDASHRTLRLHDLFRDFLEMRLKREHADEWPTLLERAAEGELDSTRAMTWWIRAQAWDRAADHLTRHGRAWIDAGSGETVMRFLQQFPPTQFERFPALPMLQGIYHFTVFDFPNAARSFERADHGLMRAALPAHAAFARAHADRAAQPRPRRNVAARPGAACRRGRSPGSGRRRRGHCLVLRGLGRLCRPRPRRPRAPLRACRRMSRARPAAPDHRDHVPAKHARLFSGGVPVGASVGPLDRRARRRTCGRSWFGRTGEPAQSRSLSRAHDLRDRSGTPRRSGAVARCRER